MIFNPTEINDVWIIQPRRFGDSRGYFMETYRREEFHAATGLDIEFVQDNESMSSYGVLRGLHLQNGAHSQAKLVRVVEGRVLDVAVDLRPGSATFGRHIALELSDDNALQLFIPRGFAHGFAVLSERAKFVYKVDRYYYPGAELTINHDDPTLGIDWKLPVADRILSEKDLNAHSFEEVRSLLAEL